MRASVGVLVTHEGGHGHAHVVVDHAARHAADVAEVAAVGLQERLRVLAQEQVGHAVVAVGHREDGNVELDAPAADGQAELAPVKLAVLSRQVRLADEALLTRCVGQQAGVDVVAYRGVAHLIAEGAKRGMHVGGLHAQLAVASQAFLLVGGDIAVQKLAHGLSQGGLLTHGRLVARLAHKPGCKGLVALGTRCHVFIHIGLHRLATDAQLTGHGTDRLRGLVHTDDVLSLYHINHFNALQ